jgi:hypothetical protein
MRQKPKGAYNKNDVIHLVEDVLNHQRRNGPNPHGFSRRRQVAKRLAELRIDVKPLIDLLSCLKSWPAQPLSHCPGQKLS